MRCLVRGEPCFLIGYPCLGVERLTPALTYYACSLTVIARRVFTIHVLWLNAFAAYHLTGFNGVAPPALIAVRTYVEFVCYPQLWCEVSALLLMILYIGLSTVARTAFVPHPVGY